MSLRAYIVIASRERKDLGWFIPMLVTSPTCERSSASMRRNHWVERERSDQVEAHHVPRFGMTNV